MYLKKSVFFTMIVLQALVEEITTNCEQSCMYQLDQYLTQSGTKAGDRYKICEKEQGNTRPHVVLILSDDQGWNDVGWHDSSVITPRLNELANNGVILENSYMQPLCTPSRSAILSGRYPFKTGLQFSVAAFSQPKFLPRNIKILPEKLKEIGYSTHMTGKWHLGLCSEDLLPSSRGFDSFRGTLTGMTDYYNRTCYGAYDYWNNTELFFPPEGSYNTDLFTKRAVEIIENHVPDDSPLFLYLAYTTPHFFLQVPQRYKDLYPHVTDPNRQAYLGMVSSLDEGVGIVVDALNRTGHMENTVVIFLSDNGGALNFGARNDPLKGEKATLWEGGTKSVGFVYSPNFLQKAGCRHKGMIHAVDWFNTILDIAKYPEAKSLCIDGVSQWKHIKTCKGSAREEFVYNIDNYVAKSAAIRYRKYKLIVGDPRTFILNAFTGSVEPSDPSNTDVRLYDLKSDPSEIYNLALEKPYVVKKLLKKLNRYRLSEVPAQNPAKLPKNITNPNGTVDTSWC